MSVLNAIGSYDDIWKAIISPVRQDYHVYDLGPTDITVQGNQIRRTDFRLLNKRGFSIQCSYFQQVNIDKAIPCVVYLHANGCSRLEGLQYLDTILSNPVSFFCFDFSGCGKSDGVYTSVGWYEQDDLECVIQYLLNTGKVSKIAVWGRSMGAATALMYAHKDPRVTCLIFDSPFCTFKKLVKDLVKKKAPIPDFLVTGALQIIRTTIQKKAGFDIDALRPIKYVDKITVPALFGAAKDDTFVSNQHTQDLYQAFGGHKQLMLFEGDHNTLRPPAWTKLVKEFLRFHLLGEKHESQIPKKSIKNLFSAADELREPTASPLGSLGSNQKSQKYFDMGRPAPVSTTQLPKQSHMNFSWLNNGASSPALSVNHTPQSSAVPSKFTEKYGADIKPENYHHHKLAPSEKKQNGLFTPHLPADPVHHHKSVQNYYESASPVNHARRTPDSPRSMTRGYFSQAHMKPQDQPAKASNTSSKSISEVHSNASFFAVKENKPKGTSGFDHSLNYFNEPKNSVSLKDTSNYHLNNTADNHLQPQKSKRKIFGPDSHQARGPQNSSIPRAMISIDLANKYNSGPISNSAVPAQRSQRDRSKRIFEKAGEAQSNSGHVVRPASSNSFTRLNAGVPEQKIPKGTPLLNDNSKKAMLLDVSNIAPYGAPAHNVSHNSNYGHNSVASMGYLDVRRISDSYSHYSQFDEPKRKDHTILAAKNGTRY